MSFFLFSFIDSNLLSLFSFFSLFSFSLQKSFKSNGLSDFSIISFDISINDSLRDLITSKGFISVTPIYVFSKNFKVLLL
jgi:hypothetical protein